MQIQTNYCWPSPSLPSKLMWSNYRQVFWLSNHPTHCTFPSILWG